ncbi:hypothetical protein [Bradyrhizobium sp. Gha]|uniref:hypothetical protein n=1 Tax=Bradyrhizobium sp. Gha TaxID=1855318 RepID=UPI0008EDED93|nr:hypothetical protein [Bradyrhizobium sp. Gha]SFI52409.1 hypothetical protein SAMN05216525_11013 [Bradyrhizobium sp. Gha]
MTNVCAIAKVAGQGPALCESCRALTRVSSATSGRSRPAPESGDFRGNIAVQLHAKVRFYDACGGPRQAAVENLVRCDVLARKMLMESRPMMAGYKRAGALNPTFRIIYREAQ